MYYGQFLDACGIDALQSAYPQFKVGIDRVLDENRDVKAVHRVGQLLHSKGIGCGAGADP